MDYRDFFASIGCMTLFTIFLYLIHYLIEKNEVKIDNDVSLMHSKLKITNQLKERYSILLDEIDICFQKQDWENWNKKLNESFILLELIGDYNN